MVGDFFTVNDFNGILSFHHVILLSAHLSSFYGEDLLNFSKSQQKNVFPAMVLIYFVWERQLGITIE